MNLKEIFLYILFFAISTLTIFSDLLFVFICTIPLLFSFSFLKILKIQFADDKKIFIISILSAFAVIAGLMLQKLASFCGLHLKTLDSNFATFQKLLINTQLFITLIMKMFNEGQSITGYIISLLNFPLLFFSLYWTFKVYKGEQDSLKKFTIFYFLCTSFFITMAFLFSRQAVDITSARYLIPIPYTFALSFSLLISDEKIKSMRTIHLIILILFTISFVFNIYESFKLKANQLNWQLARYLEKEKLIYGYAPYWHSNIISLFTENRVKVRSVMIKDGIIKPLLHNSNSDWYKPSYYEGPTFLMVPKSGSIIEETGIVNLPHIYLNILFGEFQRKLSFENMDIYIWPYNIMKEVTEVRLGANLLGTDFHTIGSIKSDAGHEYIYARKGQKGFLFLSPTLFLEESKYRIKFSIMGSTEGKAGKIKIFSPRETSNDAFRFLAMKEIYIVNKTKWELHTFDFTIEKEGKYNIELNSTGSADLKLRQAFLFMLH